MTEHPIAEFNKPLTEEDLTQHIRSMMDARPWYRKAFPFLPFTIKNESLRTFTIQFGDVSTTTKSLTKKHFIDVLIMNYRTKWYHPKYIGIQIWLP